MNFFGGKNKKENDKGISRFEAKGSSLSYIQLKLGKWYVNNRIKIRKAIIGVLVAFCVITLGGSLFYWSYYFAVGYWHDQDLMVREIRQFQNYRNLQKFYKAKSIQVDNVKVLRTGNDKYNVLAELKNVNQHWVANVTYRFTYPGGKTKSKEVVVLPQQTQPTAIFGVSDQGISQGANITLENVDWKKINPHVIEDVSTYIEPRLSFSVVDFNFQSSDSQQDTPAFVNFKIKNNSAYSYWEGDFIVKLFDNNALQAVKEISIDEFMTGQEREVSLTFLENINITRVEIFPLINVFDSEEFMNPPS